MIMDTMQTVPFPRPIVVMSKCLGFEACRYNGEMIPYSLTDLLQKHADIVTVCPEVEIGLGTPRDPIQINEDASGRKLIQPSTDRDLTSAMRNFNEGYGRSLNGVDGFILKSKSPSCGLHDVKVRASVKGPTLTGKASGFFAEDMRNQFPGLAFEDELRLNHDRIRDHFLTKLFCLAAFREAAERGRVRDLVAFHSRYKLVLMAYNQTAMRAAGRIVANQDNLDSARVFSAYRIELERALMRMASHGSHINVLMHGFGYYSRSISAKERNHYLDCMERYRDGTFSLPALKEMMRSRIYQHELSYLEQQAYFQPYPEELVFVDRKKLARERRVG